jgi:predicted dehydrogenase
MSLNGQFPTSHRLDLVHYLLGDIESVRMLSGNDDGFRFERSAGRIQARVRLGGDLRATVTMSDTYTETGMPEALILHGEAGTIHLTDLKGGSMTVTRTGPDGSADLERIETGGLPYTHWGLIENYVAHLIDGTPLLCDGSEGRKSTVALDALAEAEARGRDEWLP